MKYYKLFAAINPLEKNCYQQVFDTQHLSHSPELGLKQVRKEADRYLAAGINCYIRGFEEFSVTLSD